MSDTQEKNEMGGDTMETNKCQKTFFDYVRIISKVLTDKAYYTLWNFELFENVDRCYPKESYYQAYYKLVMNDANWVIDNLYMGSAFNAADVKWLENNNIKRIVNVTKSISNYYEDDYEYSRYDISDLNSGSLAPFYEDFYEKVTQNSDDFFLVHCFAGKSRSAALILYYIMRKNDWDYEEAIDYLKMKRPGINLNTTFVEEIKNLLM